VQPRLPREQRKPASPSRRTLPKRYHHGKLPPALLDAALHIVRTEGTHGLTLRAVARRAGVSQAAPYRHFANKEAILAAVAEEGFRSLIALIHGAVDAYGDNPLARLRTVGLIYIDFATTHPTHFRIMFGREMADRSSRAVRQLATETFNTVIEAIADCQRAGLARTEEPAADLALTAWASVHGLAVLLADGVLDRPVAEVAGIVTRDLFLGLGRRSDEEPSTRTTA